MSLLNQWNKPEGNIKDIIEEAIENKQGLAIKYRKFNGEISSRKLQNVEYNNSFEAKGYLNQHIKGLCSLRNAERTFKIDRIISVEVIK